MGERRAKREDGPASGRGPPGHAGSAAHAQACRAERGPGEDPEGEPPAAGATPGAPPLTLLHFAPAVATELPTPPQTDASQQQHSQTEAIYCGTHMVGPCLPLMCDFGGGVLVFICGLAYYRMLSDVRIAKGAFIRMLYSLVKQLICVRSFVLFVVSFGIISIRFVAVICWFLRHFCEC